MQNRRKAFWVVLMVMAIATITSCGKYNPESDFEVEPWNEKFAIITEYKGDKQIVRIPPRIQKMQVIAIDDFAFSDKELTNVTIPDSVTYIGDFAFDENLLTKVIIPKSVTEIGDWAFNDNLLTSLTIGNNVIKIGAGAFKDNELTKVIIPKSVIEIGDGAFDDNQLTIVTIGENVQFTNEIIGEGFEYVYNNNGKRAGVYTRPDDSSNTWTKRY
jgi:hypothetical protein